MNTYQFAALSGLGEARDVRVPVCCPRMRANKIAWRKSSTMIGGLFASIGAIRGQTLTMNAQRRRPHVTYRSGLSRLAEKKRGQGLRSR